MFGFAWKLLRLNGVRRKNKRRANTHAGLRLNQQVPPALRCYAKRAGRCSSRSAGGLQASSRIISEVSIFSFLSKVSGLFFLFRRIYFFFITETAAVNGLNDIITPPPPCLLGISTELNRGRVKVPCKKLPTGGKKKRRKKNPGGL